MIPRILRIILIPRHCHQVDVVDHLVLRLSLGKFWMRENIAQKINLTHSTSPQCGIRVVGIGSSLLCLRIEQEAVNKNAPQHLIAYLFTMVARSSISRVATRAVARRQMSSEPKMHTSKNSWQELKKTRPPKDHMDEHVSFSSSIDYNNY